VLIVGLLLILWSRPERRPVIAPVASDPGAEPAPPEAPPSSDLPESGKTLVKFGAPAGTMIVHDGNSFVPNKTYSLFPGSFTLMYRCPKKGRTQAQAINTSVTVDRYRSDPQVIVINCR